MQSLMGRLTSPFVDAYIRHKAAIHDVPLDRYAVRLARTEQEYRDAFRLLRVAYIVQGYENVRGAPLRMTPFHLLPESSVLVAFEGDRVVGTMTVTLDSPKGLPAEPYCGGELERLRERRARVVEFNSLAVLGPRKGAGLTLLLNMAAYRLSLYQLGATHCLCAVHPRAIPIYRALFDFAPLGPPVPHGQLELEVVPLVHDLVETQAFVRKHYRKPMQTGRLPIDHFLHDAPPCVDLPEPMSWERFVDHKAGSPVRASLEAWHEAIQVSAAVTSETPADAAAPARPGHADEEPIVPFRADRVEGDLPDPEGLARGQELAA